MPVIADVDKEKTAIILGYLTCPYFSGLKPINFIVDSGANITTILPLDVLTLKIDCSRLKKAKTPCTTAKGEIYPYILPKVQVHLKCNDGKRDSFEIFSLRQIHCLDPSDFQKRDSFMVKFPFSLLGMDILGFFGHWHWNFDDGTLTLDN